MARPKIHSKPAKLNLSLDNEVKKMADKSAFDLGKSISEYVAGLILRDRRRREQKKLRERALKRAEVAGVAAKRSQKMKEAA